MANKAFEEYRIKYFKGFLKNIYPQLCKKHKGRIEIFREEWKIPKQGLKTEKEYQSWLQKIEKEIPHKKQAVEYLEIEEYHVIEGFETIAIDYPLLTEENPRIIPQGDSLETVFNLGIKRLISEFGIDPESYPFLRYFILFNDVSVQTITDTGIKLSEKILFSGDAEPVDYSISISFGPNTEWEDLKKFWDLRIEELRKDLEGFWKENVKASKYDYLLPKLAKLDAKSKKKNVVLTDYEIAEVLFGDVYTNEKYKSLSDKEKGQIENNQRRIVRNLRYRYLRKRRS